MLGEGEIEPEVVKRDPAQKVHHQFRVGIGVVVFVHQFAGPFVDSEMGSGKRLEPLVVRRDFDLGAGYGKVDFKGLRDEFFHLHGLWVACME